MRRSDSTERADASRLSESYLVDQFAHWAPLGGRMVADSQNEIEVRTVGASPVRIHLPRE
jgi:hypothetical protein